MNRRYLCILMMGILLFPFWGNAQTDSSSGTVTIEESDPVRVATYRPTIIKLNSGFLVNSNSINNEIFKKFVFGGTIGDSAKNVSRDRLKKHNRAGGYFYQHLTIQLPADSLFHTNGTFLIFGLKNTLHFDAGFTKDLYNLAFYGNEPFKGQKMKLDNSNFNLLKYQQFEVGFVQSSILDNQIMNSGIILSLVKGQQYQSFDIEKGSILTQENNELDLTAKYDILSSDSSAKKILDVAGLGMAAQLFMDIKLSKKSILRINVSDLGFVTYNSNSEHLSQDTSIAIKGLDINKFIDGESNLFYNTNSDSLKEIIVKNKEKGKYSVSLPTLVQIQFLTYLAKNVDFNLGIKYRFLANYFPYMYASIDYGFSKGVSAGFRLAYGGYGNLAAGLALSVLLGKRCVMKFGTYNIAFLSGKYNRGASAFFGIKYFIK